MHTHYFMLGMFFFLILSIFEKNFNFSQNKGISTIIITFNIGLNIAGIGIFLRGVTDVLNSNLSNSLNASISGISGIGHIILGISLILILLKIKKSIK